MKLLQLLLLAGCMAFTLQSTAQSLPKTTSKQTVRINFAGIVKDAEKNTPIADATISAGGNVLGITKPNGAFSVSVTPGTNITITNVGYNTISLKATPEENGKTITLKSKAAGELDEVVVTALGIKRQERALGYSTTQVSGEQLTTAISGNWTDALSGKVAGLNLVRSNSGPTGSNRIILRGENNLNGTDEALVVLDGVVITSGSGRRTAIGGETVYGTGSDNMPADYGSSLNDINPEDIESITVLKGPGAAALYGQRGANGAIIITTKSGNSKRKGFGVTFNSNASMESVNRWPDLQYEYGQGLAGAAYYSYGTGVDGASTSGTSSAYGPRFNGQSFYQYNPVTQARDSVRTPWVPYTNSTRKYFDVGQTFTNTITVDGGTDRTTARLSVTNVGNKWITPNTGYKRNTIALSVNSKVNDRLTISSKINYTNKWSDNLPGAGYGNQSIMYWYIFWQPNADAESLKNYWVKGQEGRRIAYPYSSFPENPYAIAYEFLNASNRRGVTGNVQANYTITKDLNLQVRSSLDMSYEERSQVRPFDAGSRYQKGSYRTQDIFTQEVSSDFLLKYSKKVNSIFDFSATLGGSILQNIYRKNEVRADSLINPGLYTFANTAGPLVTLPYNARFNLNSTYGLFTAAYKNYLFLDLTGRVDWASTLATPTRTDRSSFFYPSANFSFVLSDAFRLPKQVDFAKLRFSAAGVGSGSTTPYYTGYTYQSAGTLYPGGALENPALLANPNLDFLFTTTYEAGVAAKFFKNRLGFDVTVYSGNTVNQILERVIDRASGYARAVINAGKVNNQGIEVLLNGTPIRRKNFSWDVSFNFSSNRNVIKELPDSSIVLRTGPVAGGQIVAKVGGSMGDLYGVGYLRAPDGQVVYDATTGFAKLAEGVQYLGNTNPKYKASFINKFNYKQFTIGFQFDAQVGGVAHSLMHYKLAEQGKTTNTLPGRYSGIIGNGVVMTADGKYSPNTTIASDIDGYYRSHFGADNAEGSTFSTDFIKFREVNLGYSIAPQLAKKLHLQRATIGLYGRNLATWSPWPMFDPEFGTLSGSNIVQGFETGQFPSTRTLGANLIIGF